MGIFAPSLVVATGAVLDGGLRARLCSEAAWVMLFPIATQEEAPPDELGCLS